MDKNKVASELQENLRRFIADTHGEWSFGEDDLATGTETGFAVYGDHTENDVFFDVLVVPREVDECDHCGRDLSVHWVTPIRYENNKWCAAHCQKQWLVDAACNRHPGTFGLDSDVFDSTYRVSQGASYWTEAETPHQPYLYLQRQQDDGSWLDCMKVTEQDLLNAKYTK